MHRLFALIFVLTLLPIGAMTHEQRPAVANIGFGEGVVKIDIRMTLEALIARIDPALGDTAESENAARYDALRKLPPAQLAVEFNGFQAEFLDGLHLIVDGASLKIDGIQAQIPEVGDLNLTRDSRVIFSAKIPAGSSEMTFGWEEKFGPVIIRVTTLAGEDGYSTYLTSGQQSAPFSVLDVTPQSSVSIFINYIAIGFQHIVPKGLDHILFVVGLFLLSIRMRPLLWQISAFTVAHTISLALGMLGLINVPVGIVEPLIAASIVYVGVENILVKGLNPWRPFIVFLFGLLHGLGFASVLSEVGMPRAQFMQGLIGFNIGVELGQLAIIAICFGLFGYWFGRKSWYRAAITTPLSLAISLIAAYWFVERIAL
ncbi:MAG: HupE/UreJ family protein [Paracoccaceae bacterium]